MKITVDFTKHYMNLEDKDKSRTFKTRGDAEDWLLEGMFGCEGAERDHYVEMLSQLKCGKTTLYY